MTAVGNKLLEAKATSESGLAEAHRLPKPLKTPLKDADPDDFVPGYSDPYDWYEP
jgi:hypothetical protein